jgi:anaerobic selenocysteine-containing dehydrogenase
VHPQDAERIGLSDGGHAAIASPAAERRVRVRVSDSVMPGVVSLPHGWGHDREGMKLGVAEKNPGVSLNDLTDDRVAEPIAAMSILNGVPVTLRPA